MVLVDRRPALVIENHDGIRLVPRSLHAGRSPWHTRQGQSPCLRPFLQQALNVRGWNVAFNDISFDDSRVAGLQAGGNSVLPLIFRGVLHFLNLDVEAICPQMLHPFTAAATGSSLDVSPLPTCATKTPPGL
jgi:hypothetical protein